MESIIHLLYIIIILFLITYVYGKLEKELMKAIAIETT